MPQQDGRAPFDDIRNLIDRMPGPDEAAQEAARTREGNLTKPPGSLGRLEELAAWASAWQGSHPPRSTRTFVAVFAGNHGVAEKGVSAFPASVTAQMVANFRAGGAAINQLCIAAGAGLKVFELALEVPTGDISVEDAMSEKDCAATFAYGMEAVAEGADLLAIGEMGIANTTIAAALAMALFGGNAEDWTGRGTGLDAEGVARKRNVVAQAVAGLHARHGENPDPLTVLQALGGREISAMAGAVLAARYQKIPVIIDGFVASAAVAVLHAMSPTALDHCLFAHRSAEQAHSRLLDKLGKAPLLDLGMRLGEGSGAALALGIVKAAIDTHNGMRTFAEAGVAEAL